MCREAITAFPADGWRSADLEHLIPTRLFYHPIETVDLYT